MRRLFGWIVAGLGCLALVLSGFWLAQPEAPAEDGGDAPGFVVPVRLAQLERGDLEPRALLSGTVRAARRAQLGFDTSGLIEELSVEEADGVATGDLLAGLSNGDEQYELGSAEASLALAQREHELMQAGTRDEEKRRLLAVLEAAGSEAELARLEVERGEKLLADRIISQSEQDQRATAYDAADKRRSAAEEEYGQALAGARSEDLAIAAARVEVARRRVQSARHSLGKTVLTAPFPGSIVRRFVSVGDYVSAGDPVYELVDLEHLEVHVEVPGRFAPRLGADTSVRLSLARELGFSIEKRLDATIPAADDEARSFRAIVRLDPDEDPGRRLKPGMSVEVELMLQPLHDVLVLPSDCVLANEDGSYVVRALPGGGDAGGPGLVADFVPVRVLAQADGRSAVESLGPPLAAGDSIVLVGGDNAFPGAGLLWQDEGAPAAGHGPGGGAGTPADAGAQE
jgi:RND family efflux transporter MFP subunit